MHCGHPANEIRSKVLTCSLTKEFTMYAHITRFLRDEEGATAIEYGIIAGLMAVILVAVFNSDTGVKGTLNEIFEHVKTVATTGATAP
jgi:pilus assembly protein Flp/PilA